MEGQNLKVKVQRLSQRSIEFDLVGVDASIANAFRRVINAEVCLNVCCLYSLLTDSLLLLQGPDSVYRTCVRVGQHERDCG
jgi:hypothetical protein